MLCGPPDSKRLLKTLPTTCTKIILYSVVYYNFNILGNTSNSNAKYLCIVILLKCLLGKYNNPITLVLLFSVSYTRRQSPSSVRHRNTFFSKQPYRDISKFYPTYVGSYLPFMKWQNIIIVTLLNRLSKFMFYRNNFYSSYYFFGWP